MRLRLKKSTTFVSLGLSTLGLVILSGSVFFAMRATPVHAQSAGQRLITVHDRGVESTFVTDKSTLREAFVDDHITLDSHDAVEPGLDEKLVAQDYQVNIYRARPVTVIDGATREKIVTPYQSAERIAKDAGITLYPEDTTTLSRSSDLIGDGAGLQLKINRATLFNLDLYGKVSDVRTQAKTVGDMLKEKNIALGTDGRTSLPASAPITAGMSVRVWKEGKQTITVDEAVPFDTQQIKDADQPLGYHAVQTPGQNGSRKVTYEINIINGQEASRTEIASLTTVEAVKQVEVIGTKLPTPLNPSESQALGHTMMLAAGFGEDQWSCLYNLWNRESGWTTTAGNPSSGAYGIPQALPASKMAVYGADYMTSARTQIAWGLDYIKGRYVSPCGAWASWSVKHWY
ncbi:MAG TPA: G5 domain-containing protein [Dongiaceae bacterium]|nr:G5 domain-containing protein [Dongiaceae bacterium]